MSQLKIKIKRHGILPSAWLAIRHILRKTTGLNFRKLIWFEHPLNEEIPKVTTKIDTEIKQVDASYLDKIQNLNGEDNYKLFQERFARNLICFAAFYKSILIAYAWMSLEDEYESLIHIPVNVHEDEAYLFDEYVLPEYRNNRIQSALEVVRLSSLQQQKYTRALAMVDNKNYPCLKIMAFVGFQPKKIVTYFSIFGIKHYNWKECNKNPYENLQKQDDVMSMRNRLISKIKAQGILPSTWLAIRYIFRKTIRLDWHKIMIFERSMEEPIQQIVPKIKVKICQATEDDLSKLKTITDEEKYQIFRDRFKKGRICFIALDGDRIIAYSWMSLANEYEPVSGIEVPLKIKEAYLFDDFVLPEYRGKGIQSALVPPRLIYLQNQGYVTAFSYVMADNKVALKTPVAFGFKPTKSVLMIKILGARFKRQRAYNNTL